jgi:DNA-directed RNA polymerase subunit alpha
MEAILPRIDTLEHTDTYGKIVMEPLEEGYGVTLGNALRRVLLSSIPGAAVTSVKIEGVLHEFSTIPGTREDATELILNLKDVHVQVSPGGDAVQAPPEPRIARLEVKGEGIVTGADIQCPPDVKVVNPSVVIAHLIEKDARLTMELTIEEGKGYLPPEKQERQRQTIGVVPIGAIFSPVRKVNYAVEATRVGRRTDLERLVLDVWTNGTITPADAVCEAAAILGSYLHLFLDLPITRRPVGIKMDSMYPDKILQPQPPEARIEELDFSVRTYNCLKKENILTIADLVKKTEPELTAIRNFGAKSLNEVKEKLKQFGLALADAAPPGGEVPVATTLVDLDE